MIHSPHDRLFKSAMADLRIARDFFDHYLPLNIQETIDLDSLKLCQNSYVDKKLELVISDVLYEVKFKSDQATAYLYLLCEHQSAIDELMPFRLWQYIIGIWRDHLKKTEEKTLPLVIPLVFYHGQKRYHGARHIKELIRAPNALIQTLFEPFHLIDTHDLADDTLREQKWAGIMTFVMKHIYARDFLAFVEPFIKMLEKLIQEPNATDYRTTLLHYILMAGDTSSIECFVETVVEHLPESEREGIMTIASRLIEKGQKKGESSLLLRLAERKFGLLPEHYRQKIEQASSEEVFHWSTKLLEVNQVSALFDDCVIN